MPWIILVVAGVLEAGWLVSLDKSESFTKIPYVVLAAVSMIMSLVLFSVSVRDISTNLAYLVWLAVGVCTMTLAKHFFFQQPVSPAQAGCLFLIFVGIAGLKMTS